MPPAPIPFQRPAPLIHGPPCLPNFIAPLRAPAFRPAVPANLPARRPALVSLFFLLSNAIAPSERCP